MSDGVAAAQDPRDPLLLDRQVCFPLYAATNLLSRLYGPVYIRGGDFIICPAYRDYAVRVY